MTDLLNDLDRETPPDGLPAPVEALWWMAKGGWTTGPEWEQAHEICQRAEGEKAHDWVHALAHWVEGDRANSDYWYRRAGEPRIHDDAMTEARHILSRLQG